MGGAARDLTEEKQTENWFVPVLGQLLQLWQWHTNEETVSTIKIDFHIVDIYILLFNLNDILKK